jgi:hypothetical protein
MRLDNHRAAPEIVEGHPKLKTGLFGNSSTPLGFASGSRMMLMTDARILIFFGGGA